MLILCQVFAQIGDGLTFAETKSLTYIRRGETGTHRELRHLHVCSPIEADLIIAKHKQEHLHDGRFGEPESATAKSVIKQQFKNMINN